MAHEGLGLRVNNSGKSEHYLFGHFQVFKGHDNLHQVLVGAFSSHSTKLLLLLREEKDELLSCNIN